MWSPCWILFFSVYLLQYMITTRKTAWRVNVTWCRICCTKVRLTMPRSDWSILVLREWSRQIAAWLHPVLRCTMPLQKCSVMHWSWPIRWLPMIMTSHVICGASELYWCVVIDYIANYFCKADRIWNACDSVCTWYASNPVISFCRKGFLFDSEGVWAIECFLVIVGFHSLLATVIKI